jgi:pimeloyl-ACP methyl ester carboxylesterase
MAPTEATVKQRVRVGDAEVAYVDAGAGAPVLFLHGCPFSSFVWRDVINALSARFRCLAPDLLGLGDTETPPDADWSLPAQADMVLGFLDALDITRCSIVGHDHGAAIAQLIAAQHPERIARLVLANAEAYDNWPSAHELPFVRATQIPGLGRLVLWAWSRRPLFRYALASGKAVADRSVLSDELVDGYIAANLADPHRRTKTRRFLAGQLDPRNQHHTSAAVTGLRRFTRQTLILWGADDVHFGPQWGQRLAADIPGAGSPVLLDGVGHLLMEEVPEIVAEHIARLLTDTSRE